MKTTILVVLDTTKVQIFKQITTGAINYGIGELLFQIPQRYRFSSKSQHNIAHCLRRWVVLDTTKVQIFKQITTKRLITMLKNVLFQIPQRYRFSSKSQHFLGSFVTDVSCFRYHKGTDFQANHNLLIQKLKNVYVVLDTTKVQIFKQITTKYGILNPLTSCFRYHKGTDFQANHNNKSAMQSAGMVVLDTTKVQIFKQITTLCLAF